MVSDKFQTNHHDVEHNLLYIKRNDYKMKSTGIVRKVDELGRIVLPIELRRILDINEKDSLEIYVDGLQIILQKYEPACIFCGYAGETFAFKNRQICTDCFIKMGKEAGIR